MAKKSAPAPQEDKSFIAEVDAALHEERLHTFWKTYKVFIIGSIIALFALVAGKQAYISHQNSTAQAAADAYLAAKTAQNMPALTALAGSKSPYATLAALDAAQWQCENANLDAAVALYNTIINNPKNPEYIKDLGRYNAALTLLNTNPTAAEAYLTPITGGKGPFRLSALELEAQILISKGEKATAETYYQEIVTNPTAPQSLRERAQQALAAL